jgi:hypothetical protein
MKKVTRAEVPQNWGFRTVWVPFGKAGDVCFADRTVVIDRVDVLNDQSIETLVGIPIFESHPLEEVVIPENFTQTKPIGVALDQWRESADGLGGEVLVRIYDHATAVRLLDTSDGSKLVEASPCYKIVDGVRVYNHLALLTAGRARGGSKMAIYSEGLTLDETTTALAESNNDYTYLFVLNMDIEQKLTEMNEKIDALAEVVRIATTEEMVEGCDPVYMEGLAAGEVLATAKSHGFTETETTPAAVTNARKFVIDKAFPSLSVESFGSDALKGAYATAVSLLAAKPEKPAAAAQTPAGTPELFIEGKPVTEAPRLKRLGRK